MKRGEVLTQLKSLHYDLEHFQEIESKENDVKALEYAINELEKISYEVPIQEKSNGKFKGIIILVNSSSK